MKQTFVVGVVLFVLTAVPGYASATVRWDVGRAIAGTSSGNYRPTFDSGALSIVDRRMTASKQTNGKNRLYRAVETLSVSLSPNWELRYLQCRMYLSGPVALSRGERLAFPRPADNRSGRYLPGKVTAEVSGDAKAGGATLGVEYPFERRKIYSDFKKPRMTWSAYGNTGFEWTWVFDKDADVRNQLIAYGVVFSGQKSYGGSQTDCKYKVTKQRTAFPDVNKTGELSARTMKVNQ